MSVTDSSDRWAAIRELQIEVSRLKSGTMLESASIDRGGLTIRALEGLTIGDAEDPTGSGTVYGILRILGQLLLEGDMDVTGGGTITVGGVVITPLGGGRIQIGPNIVLDSATQTISIGDDIVLDASDGGQIRVKSGTTSKPDIILEDGDVKAGTARLSGAQNGTIGLYAQGGSQPRSVSVADASINIQYSGTRGMQWTESATFLRGLEEAASSTGLRLVAVDGDGQLFTVAFGTGGPGGPGDGIFAWSFPLSQVTSEFRPPDRPTHDGIDFGIGPSNTIGTPIPAMGAGVVYSVLSVNDGTHGWGNGVVIDHGSDPNYGGANIKTLYAHMNTAPVVGLGDSVTLGQTLGPIGNTGNSFGAHLHLEVWVDNVPVNPRTFMAAHGG